MPIYCVWLHRKPVMNIFEELLHCQQDCVYFIENYVKIFHPTKGLKNITLYPFQKNLINHYENNDYTIYKKFRQGGFITLTVFYGLWRCMFHQDQYFLISTKTSGEAQHKKRIVDIALEHFPEWLYPRLTKNTADDMAFGTTGSWFAFRSLHATRGRSVTHLVIEEAAFIDNMEDKWKSIFPAVFNNSKVIVMSTPNNVADWFGETYLDAQKGWNRFVIFETDYKEHPLYQNEEFVEAMKSLGPAHFSQEIEANFCVGGYN